jgi:hypothetical protein
VSLGLLSAWDVAGGGNDPPPAGVLGGSAAAGGLRSHAPCGPCAGPLQHEALLRRASTGIGPVAAPPAHFAMASSLLSPFCRVAPIGALCSSEEDPFLLLQATLSCVERILKLSVGQPLRRTWIEHPYGEEEITLLEEEVIPAIQQCLQRVDAIDRVLQESRMRRSPLSSSARSWRRRLRAPMPRRP